MKPWRALIWWLFKFNGWPVTPLLEMLRQFWGAFTEALHAIIKLIALPLWPLLGLLSMCWPQFRELITSGMDRNAKARRVVGGKWTMSFRGE